jgi:anti-sigma B factor antagonist
MRLSTVEIETLTYDRTTTVRVNGELDVRTVKDLARELNHLLLGGSRYVALDLGRVDFIDSHAVSILVEAHEGFRNHRGALRIIGASAAVERVITLLKVHFLRYGRG